MTGLGRFEFVDAGREAGGLAWLAAVASLLLGCATQQNRLERVSTNSPELSTSALEQGSSGDAQACVEFQPQVVFRNNGYDHIVHLRSRCDRPTICSVATDVNPTPVDVAVPPRETVAVLTFRGSPARAFTPRVSCRFGS